MRSFWLGCVGALVLVGVACGEGRTALVIGNSNYPISALKNPVNDATDMAKSLQQLGFDVILSTDAGKRQMESALDAFESRLKVDGIGLIYYAGHGIQIKDVNYLIPVDIKIETERDVEFDAINVSKLSAMLTGHALKASIMILDACRDNPFPAVTRSLSRGLSVVSAARSSIVVYSTAPGSVAADGEGRNGLFTEVLLQNLQRKDEINDILTDVRKELALRSNYKQISYVSTSLLDRVYLNPPEVEQVPIGLRITNKSVLSADKEAKIREFFSARLELSGRFKVVPEFDEGATKGDFLIEMTLANSASKGILVSARVINVGKNVVQGTKSIEFADWDEMFSRITTLGRLSANLVLGIEDFSFSSKTAGLSIDLTPTAGFLDFGGRSYRTFGASVGFATQSDWFTSSLRLALVTTDLPTLMIYGNPSLDDWLSSQTGSSPNLILPSVNLDLMFGDKTKGLAAKVGFGGFYDFALRATIAGSLGFVFQNWLVSYDPIVDIKLGVPAPVVVAHNFSVGYSIFLGTKGKQGDF